MTTTLPSPPSAPTLTIASEDRYTADVAKVFVLDTSVILYDSNVVESFQDNDLAIPMAVLEELDGFKKGNNVLNFHAREFIRRVDRLSQHNDLRQWLAIDGEGVGQIRVLTEEANAADVPPTLHNRTNDHRILLAALQLAREEPDRPVILVSKDINLRVKARTLGLPAEDYEKDKIQDVEHLYTGHSSIELESDRLIERLFAEGELPPEELTDNPRSNHYFILRGPGKSALATIDEGADGEVLRPILKETAYGIQPRNAEQTFALHAVLRHNASLVSLTGAAGTGKTLLALAGAVEQRKDFRQIYLARPVVPLSNKDIGYLPGDISSKINPYMQPLWDNLNVIKNQFEEGTREYRRLDEMVEQKKLHIAPLAYIRGRSLSKVMFIVDEAQNLSPHEIKTIITRAGEGTKMVFTGDIFQIDTPYLDAESNGLSYLIDRMKGQARYAHISLRKGERSELANLASRLL